MDELNKVVFPTLLFQLLQCCLVVKKFCCCWCLKIIFLPEFNLLNTQKSEFFEVFKNQLKLYHESYKNVGILEMPGADQGDPPCGHTTWWRGPPWPAPGHGVGPPGPPLNHSPPWTLSLPDHSPTIAQTRVLAAIFRVFLDLLVQPIICAEIWSI